MKRRSYKWAKWMALGLILLIPLAMVWIVASHPIRTGNNLERSHRLAATKGLAYYSGCEQGYTWLDAGTVRQIDSVEGNALLVKDTDVATGITRTTASFAKRKEEGFIDKNLTHLSPDRKWILYTGSTADTLMRNVGPLVSSQTLFDKSSTKQKPLAYIVHRVAWMRDSLHWVELSEGAQGKGVLILHTIGSPATTRWALAPMVAAPGTTPLRMLIGITDRNTALIKEVDWKPGLLTPMRFVEVDLKTGQRSSNTGLSQLAPLTHLYSSYREEPALSPQGDRLVWVRQEYPDLVTILARMLRHKPQTIRYEVLSCRLDGSQYNLVDSVESGNMRERVNMVEWLPDGKQVSFVFQNFLYTAPAD